MSDELSIDYLDDDRVLGWKDNLERIVNTLSVSHSYENGEMTKETGPGLLVVQVADDSIEDYASAMNPNPFAEPEDPTYMDGNLEELFPLFKENAIEDGATVIMGNGRVLDSNVLLEPPEETYEKAESNPEYGAKHMWGARASAVSDIIYTTVLSSTNGTHTTFVDGEQREAPIRRDDLIEEINEGEAEWVIDEHLDEEELDWLEAEN